jgi:hypothetical protein
MTACIPALVLGLAMAPQAPAAAPDASHSQAIVQELRALREAVEQVLATNVRVQLLMGRLQLQEARIQALVRQSADIDSQVQGMAAERQALEQQRRMMEGVPNATADPEEREFAKHQLGVLAERLKQLENRHASLLAEQANVQQLVATEQSRWGDFNLRLEELERLLGSPRR